MKTHTRVSDEELLIQFVKDQGFDHIELMDAVERLENCIKKSLEDYVLFENENFKLRS